jgi:hypothetical protein
MRHRIVLSLSALVIVGLLAALASSAIAGGATAAKKKKKVCPAGTHKVVIKKHGKKKRKCLPNQAAVPPSSGTVATATLSISPTSNVYPATQHGGACPGPNCPTKVFTVTNTGAAASGVPVVSITEIHNPEIGGPPAFTVLANTCTAAVAPGGTCSVTVGFHPNSNAGDQQFSSVLHVIASPGGDASSQLSGMAL